MVFQFLDHFPIYLAPANTILAQGPSFCPVQMLEQSLSDTKSRKFLSFRFMTPSQRFELSRPEDPTKPSWQSLLHYRATVKGYSQLHDFESLLHTLQFDDYEADSDLPSFSTSLLEMDEMTELSINSQPEKVKTLDNDDAIISVLDYLNFSTKNTRAFNSTMIRFETRQDS